MITPNDITRARTYPLLALESLLSHRMRHSIHHVVGGILALFTIIVTGAYILDTFNLLVPSISIPAQFLVPKLAGAALILAGIWGVVFLLEAFFRSYYLKESRITYASEYFREEADLLSLEAGRIIYHARRYGGDITRGFFASRSGDYILRRCGITRDDRDYFLGARAGGASYGIEIPAVQQNRLFTLTDLAQYIITRDAELAEFLFTRGIKEDDFAGAAEWVRRESEEAKEREQWWSRERLGRIPGIGKDWSYGKAYRLARYAREISGAQYRSMFQIQLIKRDKELAQLETVLARARESNALLVGEPGTGMMDIVHTFALRVRNKEVNPMIEYKRVVLLDTDLLVSQTGDKRSFETEFIGALENAVDAGNIVLVIKDLPQFALSARAFESDVIHLLDPYLSSPDIHVVATSDTDAFHRMLERNASVARRFEKISVSEADTEAVTAILERMALRYERDNPLFFTYPAIVEIIRSADRHITSGVMPDKAIDVFIEVVSLTLRKRKYFVEEEDVHELIRQKTNIPIGKIEEIEREQLFQLEEILHRRVVGQNEAINTVSNAMRRARAGVRDAERPIGSFLFLGPTGVGKTETAKALAEAFFGDDDRMMRIDMSEYQGSGALGRMIGSIETGSAGTLAKLLREHPYGVLLLDEFEKSNSEVLDLFLQVFDEGFFSDTYGKRVNARNAIIVATSNAGSEMIWNAINRGESTAQIQEPLIERLIDSGVFRPELLNRFDAVVLFHPLNDGHLREIARVMLERLAHRLREQNSIELEVSDDLIRHVAEQPYNQSFGARPMNRFIQEHVEQHIAEKIIAGAISEGARIYFAQNEIRVMQ